jgi:adenosylcobinamide kinase / adenosylcobinamide-phosphate guanylyltransferase
LKPAFCLVTGGVRSGKSRLAEQLAAEPGGRVLYVATAGRGDGEMARRIDAHRARRPAHWDTLEVEERVGIAIGQRPGAYDSILLDDIGLLVSNVLASLSRELAVEVPGEGASIARVRAELDALEGARVGSDARWVVVTQEVGLGLVAQTPLGRRFQDVLGWANQQLARHADCVYLVVAGHAIDVVGLGRRVE